MSSPASGGRGRQPFSSHRPQQGQWRSVADALVELHRPFPTHYNASTATASRLDRDFVALPPWAALKF
eukprot:4686212-Lingulodinium_polyedra.AAC.1